MDDGVKAPQRELDQEGLRGNWRRVADGKLVRRIGKRGTLALLGAVFVFLVVLPVLTVVLVPFTQNVPRLGEPIAFTFEHILAVFSTDFLSLSWDSLWICVGALAVSVGFGATLAFISARTDAPFRKLIHVCALIPLIIPALVSALAWSYLGSPRQGMVNIFLRSIGEPFVVNIYSELGIMIVLGLSYTPYIYLLTHSALSAVSAEQEEAALVHGATIRGVLRRVTLPLATPAVSGAALLTFALLAQNFVVPEILGRPAGIELYPSRIYHLMTAGQPGQAAVLGMVLMIVLVLLLVVQRFWVRKRTHYTISGKGMRPRQISLGVLRWPATCFAFIYALLAAVLPTYALVLITFRRSPYLSDLADLLNPFGLSFDNILRVLTTDSVMLALRNTLIVGVATAVIGTTLCALVAYLVHRTSVPGRGLFEYLAMLPLGVPALLLGLGFLWAWLPLNLPIYGTLVILVMAYIAHLLPQGFRSASASMGAVHIDLEDSAVVAGASRLRAALYVTAPLIRQGITSTGVILLVLSMRELAVALFLFTTDTRMLSIALFDYWNNGSVPLAAGVGFLYTALLLIIAFLGRNYLVRGLGGDRMS